MWGQEPCPWLDGYFQDKQPVPCDGGYGSHFKLIGEQYGPFDITFLECGQAVLFRDIHMIPEQTVQAQIDLMGQLMIPIHWRMFSQSNPN